MEKGKVWRGNVGWKCGRSVGKRREREADGGWKCEAGAGHVRILSPTNSGCSGFVEVLMSESY